MKYTTPTPVCKYKRFPIIAFLLFISVSSFAFPPKVEKALQKAGTNRGSLERLLKHYSRDKQKYQAACFLIENMDWHWQSGEVKAYDPAIDRLFCAADSICYAAICAKQNDSTATPNIRQKTDAPAKMYRDSIQKHPFHAPHTIGMDMPDITCIDGDFLRRHIDNAFLLWKQYTFSPKINFDDFCHYMLPYRVITDYPLVQNGKELNTFFAKYMQAEKPQSIKDAVKCYNQIIGCIRSFGGQYPFDTLIGLKELLFHGYHDCIDIAHYGASILRACGVPVAVEFNAAYKLWNGRHYHVATIDSAGRWCTFSPESSLPVFRNPGFAESTNMFRLRFAPHSQSPFMLKAQNEFVPEIFSSPCIEDVSADEMTVTSLTLPFDTQTENNVAYLGSFLSREEIAPVTWGVVDRTNKQVHFANVVPDNLYFPIYYEEMGERKSFGSPFWIATDSLAENEYTLSYVGGNESEKISTKLLRKFPRKPKMRKLAENLKGTVVIASDIPNFSKADTLYRMTDAPEACWQEIDLKNEKPYKFYRIQNRPEYPHLHMAEIEFLTDTNYHYANVMNATPLPIQPSSSCSPPQDNLVRLLDEPLEKCNWKAEYDGKVETAPDAWPSVTLKLEQSQVVTRIRFVPKHAGNDIVPGDDYRLYAWENGKWETVVHRQKATRHYLPMNDLDTSKIYWLRNLSRGKEELPFVVNKAGKQCFIHEPLLEKLQQ